MATQTILAILLVLAIESKPFPALAVYLPVGFHYYPIDGLVSFLLMPK